MVRILSYLLRHLILVLALSLSLPGAEGGLRAQPKEDGPGSEVVASGGIVAREGGAARLDLAACVRVALDSNEFLQAERLRMAELAGQMDQALSTGLPTLDLVGGWTRSRDPSFALDSTFGGDSGGTFAPPIGADPWFDDWLAGFGSLIPAVEDIPAQAFLRTSLNLNWEINPLKISGAVGAAKLGVQRQEAMLVMVEQQTVESTVAAYYSIIKAAQRVDAVKAQLANQTELLEIVKIRNEMGLATALDTLQAAVSLANVQPQLSIARATLRNEGARLNALMGLPPQSPLEIANQQVVEMDTLHQERALELGQLRPDLQVASIFTDILRRNRKAQIADNRPYLTIGGSYGYVGKTTDTLFDQGHESWRASVALNVPVFDGLLTRGLVAETQAKIRRSEKELSGNRRQVEVEILEILANLMMAREVLTAVELNLTRSEEVLEESLLMLQLGKTSYLDVLVAEANRAQARGNVINARYEVLVLTASLKRALGFSPLNPLAAIPGLVVEVDR